mmetsp:Transcript_6538/g.20406  ORF Transcript_6538/g.20406 Transcript_6538/m.20406 type:complete len:200 (+) Transcript_6538:63-662(+)
MPPTASRHQVPSRYEQLRLVWGKMVEVLCGRLEKECAEQDVFEEVAESGGSVGAGVLPAVTGYLRAQLQQRFRAVSADLDAENTFRELEDDAPAATEMDAATLAAYRATVESELKQTLAAQLKALQAENQRLKDQIDTDFRRLASLGASVISVREDTTSSSVTPGRAAASSSSSSGRSKSSKKKRLRDDAAARGDSPTL